MSALMEQHERWVSARSRLDGTPRRPPRDVVVAEPHKPWVSPFSRVRDPDGWLNQHAWWTPPAVIYDAGPFYTPKMADWRQIADEVAQKHRLFVSDLRSPRRDQEAVYARHEAFWRCKRETDLSLPQIGRRFGGRDHTTVIHGIKKHQERIDKGLAK